MNNINFSRGNGNVPKKLAGEDHVSGFLVYVEEYPQVAGGFAEGNNVMAVSTIARAEEFGIVADAADWKIKVLHYQLREVFRVNPNIELYLGMYKAPASPSAYTFDEIKKMQYYAGGAIRQVGVWLGDQQITGDLVTALQGAAMALEAEDIPLSVLAAPKVNDLNALPELAASSSRVSVVIGQAGSGLALELFNAGGGKAVSGLGTVLGLTSLAGVHESIGAVARFPAGIDVPAFSNGKLYCKEDSATINALDKKRYVFFRTYSGLAGSYVNDSHNMDRLTSDYSMIENVRTMDKAVRNIRTYLLPELGSKLYVDAQTGKLQIFTVEYLKSVANRALEDMERAGELSGYSVDIDPDQNVLATSTVEFVIKQVGVGVLRNIHVNIGFATKVEQ